MNLNEKEHPYYYWLIKSYVIRLGRTKRSRKRKELARKIIWLCKGSDKRIMDISDDFRFNIAFGVYKNVLNK